MRDTKPACCSEPHEISRSVDVHHRLYGSRIVSCDGYSHFAIRRKVSLDSSMEISFFQYNNSTFLPLNDFCHESLPPHPFFSLTFERPIVDNFTKLVNELLIEHSLCVLICKVYHLVSIGLCALAGYLMQWVLIDGTLPAQATNYVAVMLSWKMKVAPCFQSQKCSECACFQRLTMKVYAAKVPRDFLGLLYGQKGPKVVVALLR